MQEYKRILVGLDNTLMDYNLIEYVAFICKKFQPSKIYFTNVQESLVVPDKIIEDHPQFREPLDEKLAKEIKKNVKNHFPDVEQYDVEYEVIEGSALKEILHRLEVKNIDLLVMGRKKQLPGKGILPAQIARHCNSSLLLVTEAANRVWDKIFVPVDFSEWSKLALQKSVEIAMKKQGSQVIPFHLYDIPSLGTGISYGAAKMAPLIQSSAVECYNDFIKDMDTTFVEIKPSFQLNNKRLGAITAHQQAVNFEADLIVLGAQGKTGLKRAVLGSFTEKLINSDATIPILVVKKHREKK